MKKTSSRCDVCGKAGVLRRRLPRTYGRGPTLLVVEDVPVMVCPNCGESYLTAETLQEIERIKLLRRSLAKSRSVAVANFG
ncbi:MAG: type II toxin-antitoxin system MqsA family antitoxin [Acidobacteriia bacterium]|nr:type II toxin-antitoxin system MqsA family antitoxin [Terriglobia bacterium]